MIAARRARPADAPAIGAIHVATWRSTYAGILPDDYLAGLSAAQQAARYARMIMSGIGVHVVTVSGAELETPGAHPRTVGFATTRRNPGAYGDGEIETLYVLDDWRDRGVGRRLMRASATWLAAAGCASAWLWVLRDNPNRWFYERLGGRRMAEQEISVAGRQLIQVAYAWPTIADLTSTESAP